MTEISMKRGKFYITIRVIKNNLSLAQKVMKHCVPVKADYAIHMDAIEYQAISDQFDLIEPCETIPEYDVAVSLVDGEDVFMGFKRIR